MSMNFMKKICLGSLSFAMMAGIFACSGENGVDGRDGRDGKDGSDGRDGKDGVAGKNGEDGESTTDTLYVVKKDTVIFAGDTIYISKKDTVTISKKDTVTISKKDTVTISKKDTVYIVNDISSSSKIETDVVSSSSAETIVESSNSSETASMACTAEAYDESDYHNHNVLVDCGDYSFVTEYVKAPSVVKWGDDLVDDRGGNSQTYKTVIIGEQTWMAENLNYAVNDGVQSWCYNQGTEGVTEDVYKKNCETYGRLYTWAAAVGKSEDDCGENVDHTCSLPSGNIQGVCPDGWHLPSNAEWTTLNDFVDAHNGTVGVGTDLKSLTGWLSTDQSSGNGNDLFAFSALPAGVRNYGGKFEFEGKYSYFWTSEEGSETTAYYRSLGYNNEKFGGSYYHKDRGYSVRCLKD